MKRFATAARAVTGTVCVAMAAVACGPPKVVVKPDAQPVAAAPTKPAATPPPEGGRVIVNDEIGFSVEIPADSDMVSNRDPSVVARSPADGTTLRVYVEHLPQTATQDSCWARLYASIGRDMPARPASPDDMRKQVRGGVDRDDRRVYLDAFAREDSFLVLLAEGPKESSTLLQAAPRAIATFKLGKASAKFVAESETATGLKLLADKKFEDALKHFEMALKQQANDLRAQFGAGLSAYFAGPEFAAKAVEHLTKAAGARYDPDGSEGESLRPEQYREVLMYLGLANASLKQYTKAAGTLAELVDRFPDDAVGRYNFACVLALAGDTEEALEQLRNALQLDPDLTDHAREDDDLKSLHPLPQWKVLLGDAQMPPAEK